MALRTTHRLREHACLPQRGPLHKQKETTHPSGAIDGNTFPIDLEAWGLQGTLHTAAQACACKPYSSMQTDALPAYLLNCAH